MAAIWLVFWLNLDPSGKCSEELPLDKAGVSEDEYALSILVHTGTIEVSDALYKEKRP